MNNLLKQKAVKLVALTLIGLLYFGCNDSLTPTTESDSIDVEFPVGKKAIYAVAVYSGDVDSLKTMFLSVYSLQFDSILTNANGTEYIGRIEHYDSIHFDYDGISYDPSVFYESGNIVVTVNDKWVLFQQSEVRSVFQIFMKSNSIESDTTELPTEFFNQLPMFPNRLEKNSSYSIFRPGEELSPGAESLFIGVQRNFEVEDYVDWNDIYGSNRGLYYTSEHKLEVGRDFTFDYRGIIDSEGVVVSTSTKESVITTLDNPDGIDTLSVHTVNRRIVDFGLPETMNELSWYAKNVSENGLKLLNE